MEQLPKEEVKAAIVRLLTFIEIDKKGCEAFGLRTVHTPLAFRPPVANFVGMNRYTDHGTEKIDLNSYSAPNPASRFLIMMDSDMMTGAGLFKGDLVIVDKDVQPTDGCLVVAFTDQFLLRRYVVEGDAAVLIADPDAHPPIPVGKEQVWGVVVGVQRRY